jgi:hypothetical protein
LILPQTRDTFSNDWLTITSNFLGNLQERRRGHNLEVFLDVRCVVDTEEWLRSEMMVRMSSTRMRADVLPRKIDTRSFVREFIKGILENLTAILDKV